MKLLTIAIVVGAVLAIACAIQLLRRWRFEVRVVDEDELWVNDQRPPRAED